MKLLRKQCEELLEACKELEAKAAAQLPRLEIGSSVVWDLSSYDFTAFYEDELQPSEKFQIGSTGVTAWLGLYPRGESDSSEGMAGLFLYVDQPATVKWTWQSGSGEVKTEERDLRSGRTVSWHGQPDFMPISETNGSITLRILSVRMKGSTLRFS